MKPPIKPPMKHGVSASVLALPPGRWPTVLDYLVERFPHLTREALAERMVLGEMMNETGMPISPTHEYLPRQNLYYYRTVNDEVVIPFEERVLFQDDFLVAVDKPHFLPVTPIGKYVQESLLVRLKRKLGFETLAPMHRIDRETAGVVLFTIQPQTRGRYQSLFESREVDKQYEAVAPWRSDLAWPLRYQSRVETSSHFMQMHEVPGEPNAETEIDVIEHNSVFARYRLTPRSGRKHQLRVQMAGLGMPIVNDLIYPVLQKENATDFEKPLQLLAKSIAFCDPMTGERREFVTGQCLRPLPNQR